MEPQAPPLARTVVTSAEFTRQFGHLRQSSSDEPVFVTHHGRETHVLMTSAAYHAVQAKASGAATVSSNLPSFAALANWIQEACLILDDDMRILHANRVAHAMLNREEGTLLGRIATEAFPEMEGSLLKSYIVRAMATREPCTADLPSLLRPDRWVRLQVFPSVRNTTILVHDITEDVKTNRLADYRKAIVDASRHHGCIGLIVVNPRGRIERTNKAISTILKLPEERLADIGIVDLVPLAKRVEFRELLETTLRGGGPTRVDTEFMANDGTAQVMRVGLAELRGAYGNEGAVLVVTPE